MRSTTRYAAVCLAVCLAGCETQPAGPAASGSEPIAAATPSGTIGTINIARIYQLMGLQQQLKAKQRELGQKLKKVDDEQKAAIKGKLDEFGGDLEKLTDEQSQELQKLETLRMRVLQQAQADLRQQMDETNQYLNNVFMQKTREPIRKVAEARGLDAVLVQQQNMFAYIKPTTDITDDVIKEIGIPLLQSDSETKAPPSPLAPGRGPLKLDPAPTAGGPLAPSGADPDRAIEDGSK